MSAQPIELPPPAAAPCPSWCDMPAGHPYCNEDRVAHTVSRHHGAELARLGEHSVNISAIGVASSDDSPTETVERPLIDVNFFENTFGREQYVDDLTAAEARELAHFIHGALLKAANRLEQIEAQR
jgi:hypothetical protein